MNLPNKLTLARLIATVPFVACLSSNFPGAKLAALILFIAATITDFADGYIARKYNLITDFGKLMDPLVDKILTVAAFICLVALQLIPAWIVIIIVSREFLITGMRLIAVSKGQVLAAENLGKYKTAAQMVTICYFLLGLSIAEATGHSATGDILGVLFVILTLILTIWSGLNYVVKNRTLFQSH